MKPEKRRVERITFDSPINGLLNKQVVKIIDLSTDGARVEHPSPITGRKVLDLRFTVDDQELVIACELVRSRLRRSGLYRMSIVYCSGLRFRDPAHESISRARSLVERHLLDSEATLSIAV